MDLATTVWVTLHEDGLKAPFSSGKDTSIFTAMYFDLEKRDAESAANVATIDIVTIEYKKAGRGGRGLRSKGMAGLLRSFRLRKREVAAKSTFTRMLAWFFCEDVADWVRVIISIGMRLRRYAVNFPTPQEAGQVPLPEFTRIRDGCVKQRWR